jgi:holin-like protein
MVLLALALGSGILPLTLVEDASKLLLQHLSLFFVPAGVGLLAYGVLLKGNWIPIALAIVGGTMVTLLGTAGIHLLLLRNGRLTDHTEEG